MGFSLTSAPTATLMTMPATAVAAPSTNATGGITLGQLQQIQQMTQQVASVTQALQGVLGGGGASMVAGGGGLSATSSPAFTSCATVVPDGTTTIPGTSLLTSGGGATGIHVGLPNNRLALLAALLRERGVSTQFGQGGALSLGGGGRGLGGALGIDADADADGDSGRGSDRASSDNPLSSLTSMFGPMIKQVVGGLGDIDWGDMLSGITSGLGGGGSSTTTSDAGSSTPSSDATTESTTDADADGPVDEPAAKGGDDAVAPGKQGDQGAQDALKYLDEHYSKDNSWWTKGLTLDDHWKTTQQPNAAGLIVGTYKSIKDTAGQDQFRTFIQQLYASHSADVPAEVKTGLGIS